MPDVTLVDDQPFDLDITGGHTFVMDVQYVNTAADGTETPVPLDPATDVIVGQVAKNAGGKMLAFFDCEITDGDNGWFRVTMSSLQTRKLVKHSVYEIVLITGGDTFGLFAGEVRFERGVIQ